jgi:sulfate permease, SulP family
MFQSLKGYQSSWLSGDFIAGLTVWAVLVPEALAYARIAGVSPVMGLYAVPPALILYALFGSSRHLVIGPSSATAAVSAAVVGVLVSQGDEKYLAMTAALAIVVGLLALAARLLRLGFLVNFISEPVLKGFIIGLALTIIAGQLPDLFGVEKGSGDFFEKTYDLFTHLDDTNGWTLLVGLVCLGAIFGLREKAPLLPASLVAVAIGLGAVVVFGLDDKGVAIIGNIDSGAPTLGLPSGVAGSDFLDLAPGAVGVLVIGFAEGLAAAKSYALKNGYRIDANRELIGLGTANLGAGLSNGIVVNGSLSKTAVNGGAGAKSQVSGLIVAGFTVVTYLFLTGLFENLPDATLAAIVIAAVVELVDIPSLIRLYDIRSTLAASVLGPAARADFIAAAAALLGVLLFDTLPGLFLGITISYLLLVFRAYRPRIAVLGRVPGSGQYADVTNHPENEQVPGVLVVRVESGLFFANADNVREEIERLATQDGLKAVVLDAETVPSVDLTAVGALLELHEALRRNGISLVMARNIGQVREMFATQDSNDLDVYPTVREAVQALTAVVRPEDRKEGSSSVSLSTPGI